MPNYLEYQKSVAAEFRALENRVRYLIDKKHWGEEGRYKEAILMNYLKRVLPKHLSAGTGFVRRCDEITKQIDIIIYDNTYPLLFSEGDFIISTAENVVAIIEVKTNIEPSKLGDYICKANENAKIIIGDTDKTLFNGIFSYNMPGSVDNYIDKISEIDHKSMFTSSKAHEIIPREVYSCVNHLALGSELFVRLWPLGQDEENKTGEIKGVPEPYYSVYQMDEGLAFSYFFSNLQEHLIRLATGNIKLDLPDDMKVYLFPLVEGKETHLKDRVYLNDAPKEVEQRSKFKNLEGFFCSSTEKQITLSFKQVEEIIGQELSTSAYKYSAYWHPSKTHTITKAWINAGYRLVNVDIKEELAFFTKQ